MPPSARRIRGTILLWLRKSNRKPIPAINNTPKASCLQIGISAPSPRYVKSEAEPNQHNGHTPTAPAPSIGNKIVCSFFIIEPVSKLPFRNERLSVRAKTVQPDEVVAGATSRRAKQFAAPFRSFMRRRAAESERLAVECGVLKLVHIKVVIELSLLTLYYPKSSRLSENSVLKLPVLMFLTF